MSFKKAGIMMSFHEYPQDPQDDDSAEDSDQDSVEDNDINVNIEDVDDYTDGDDKDGDGCIVWNMKFPLNMFSDIKLASNKQIWGVFPTQGKKKICLISLYTVLRNPTPYTP